MFQGGAFPHGPDVRLRGHFHAVLQGAGDGHPAQRGGLGGHRPRHWHPVRPGDYAGPKRRPLHGGPAARTASGRGFSGGE